ncbi:MAG: 30S ribosome-binding factor RbfA [Clostridia bacterium]|jgi:ribosome-binding factor A|nr:30S ribosome-binding factor RbfA [Clostridia bacterium]MDE7071071.1 30S ribosome-binding factor RbfA [Clostridia bacterium]
MNRYERINAELKKQLSIILREGVSDPRVAGKMICVTDTQVDTDLTLAQVYISILGANGKEQEVLDGLHSAEGYIKSRLKNMIKLRSMPALRFKLDTSYDYGTKISKIIDELHKNESKASEDNQE